MLSKAAALGEALPTRAEQDGAARPGPMASLFRNSEWDGLLVILATAYGVALILRPSIVLIALGVWWGLNTVAHNFIHLPFFKSRILNRCFSAYLSVLFGIPQRLWRDRHLSHHSGRKWHLRMSIQLTEESSLVGLLWLLMVALAPEFFWTTYLPGWLIGLVLCQLHGYYEHARGTTSHYGKLYNVLFFNDGYHAEHHVRPAEHWTRLHLHSHRPLTTSRWPAFLRWLELVSSGFFGKTRPPLPMPPALRPQGS